MAVQGKGEEVGSDVLVREGRPNVRRDRILLVLLGLLREGGFRLQLWGLGGSCGVGGGEGSKNEHYTQQRVRDHSALHSPS